MCARYCAAGRAPIQGDWIKGPDPAALRLNSTFSKARWATGLPFAPQAKRHRHFKASELRASCGKAKAKLPANFTTFDRK
jgi:hypothetical protein